MKKSNIYILTFALLFAASLSISNDVLAQTRIEIEVTGITDSVAYLGNHFADRRFVIDTAQISNSESIVFESEKTHKPGLYFFYTPNVYFEFIVNESEIIIESAGPDYAKNMKVIKSEENKIFLEMQSFIGSKRQGLMSLREKLESESIDSAEQASVGLELKKLDQEVRDYQTQLAQQHKDMFISRMIYASIKPERPVVGGDLSEAESKANYQNYKNSYFQNIDISDAGLLRTPILHQRIMDYLDKVVLQDPDSIIKEVDMILLEAAKNAEVFRYALVTLTGKYENPEIMGLDEVFVHLVDDYYLKGKADWTDQVTLDKMNERITTMKHNFIGEPAPKLVLNDTLMSSHALYDIKADFMVLYFYDPDCGHCKTKTPILFESYGNMRNKSVEVVAINTTTNTERWKEYIRENNYDWVNLADTFSKSYFRYYYDIRSTPTIYILDKDKKIIARKLDATQVETFIENARNWPESGQ